MARIKSLLMVPLIFAASYLPAQQATPAEQPASPAADASERTKPRLEGTLAFSSGVSTRWRFPQTGIDLTRGAEQLNTATLGISNLLRTGDSLEIGGFNTCTLTGKILDTPKRGCSELDATSRYTTPFGKVLGGTLSGYGGYERWVFVNGDLGADVSILATGARWKGPRGFTVEFPTYTLLSGDYAGGWTGQVAARQLWTLKAFKDKSTLDASIGGESGVSRRFFDDQSGARLVRGDITLSYAKGNWTLSGSYRPQLAIASGKAAGVASTPEYRGNAAWTIPVRK